MKALRYDAVRSSGPVALEDIAMPVARDGEALVKVVAAGVNPVDAKIAAGSFHGPAAARTLGIDFAGTVTASSRWSAGSRVLGSLAGAGLARDGAFAEYVTVEDDALVEMPPALGFDAAATIGVIGLTAHMAVIGAPASKRDETIVIHGAGGGVGSACIQIAARVVGARTIAVVSGDEGAVRARSIGAQQTIDRRGADVSKAVLALTSNRGADVIIDVVGGAVFESSVTLLAPFGRLVAVGLSAGANRRVAFDLVEFYRTNRRILGVTSSTLTGVARAALLRDIVAWIADGTFTPPEPEIMPLARGVEALARMMAPDGVHGKVVLRV